jgi:hypothetical protein
LRETKQSSLKSADMSPEFWNPITFTALGTMFWS